MTQPHQTENGSAPSKALDGGFTLVELMIAVLILSVGILGVAQVFAVADRHTASAREETVAAALAQEIEEKVLSETFDDIVAIFNGVDTSVPSSITLPASDWAEHLAQRLGPYGRGVIEVRIPAQDPTLANGMLGVLVTISWKEAGQDVSLPLRFTVAKVGA